jgi:hypothetical protein
MKDAVWVTIEGEEIPVVELGDLHLQRIVRMGLRAERSVLVRESGAAAVGLTAEATEFRFLEELTAEQLPILQRRLLQSRRFAPVVTEARRRGVGVFTAAHCD